jgi:hypothetical protein
MTNKLKFVKKVKAVKTTSMVDVFFETPKEKLENNFKVTMGFRCDLTTKQRISKLSEESKITVSEWINLVIEDAVKNNVEVSKTVTIKYKNQSTDFGNFSGWENCSKKWGKET